MIHREAFIAYTVFSGLSANNDPRAGRWFVVWKTLSELTGPSS